MTSNWELAESYFNDAKYSLVEAKNAFKASMYHRSIRRCQEAVELSLKAILRLCGVEYPKDHEVSLLIYKIKDKLPKWFTGHLKRISEISISLSIQRALASMVMKAGNYLQGKFILKKMLKRQLTMLKCL